jgi:two-component system sensor histidine kinase/response regulator
MKKNYTIMIVDDEPENLEILESMLDQEGYGIAAFPSGTMALSAAIEDPPDLVLLDIRMPLMDGYAFCENFKKHAGLKDIPIIFLSALNDLKDKIRAFDVGGVDYIIKPFSEKEVIARVKNHLQLRQYQISLEQLVDERTKKLSDAYERLKVWDDAKGIWLDMLSHEIRTPLNGLFGATQMIIETHPSCNSDFERIVHSSMDRVNKLIDDAFMMVMMKVNSSEFISQLMKINLQDIMQECVNNVSLEVKDVDIVLKTNTKNQSSIVADYFLLYRALQDLVMTATKCIQSGGDLEIEVIHDNSFQCLMMKGFGKIEQNEMDTFFNPFGQKTCYKADADFGLGPALAKIIINLFSGSVSIQNAEQENQFVIKISFPLDDDSSKNIDVHANAV